LKQARGADRKPRSDEEAPRNDTGDREAGIDLVVETAESLFGEREGPLWGSIVKQTIKRKRPNFDEGAYGFRTFSELLEEAQKRGLLRLKHDERAGGYIISGLGAE
jgi:hypothetical protein